MEQLKAKLKKQGGFTMVELLIVVAIIGILAAVSIPLFNNALEKARHGVDAANIRSAISMANAEVVVSNDPVADFTTPKYYDYIVDDEGDHQGELVPATTKNTPSSDAVQPKCSDIATKKGLQVEVKYDPDATGNNLIDKIIITANWQLKSGDANGHYEIKDF